MTDQEEQAYPHTAWEQDTETRINNLEMEVDKLHTRIWGMENHINKLEEKLRKSNEFHQEIPEEEFCR